MGCKANVASRPLVGGQHCENVNNGGVEVAPQQAGHPGSSCCAARDKLLCGDLGHSHCDICDYCLVANLAKGGVLHLELHEELPLRLLEVDPLLHRDHPSAPVPGEVREAGRALECESLVREIPVVWILHIHSANRGRGPCPHSC